jgi:hypothetical protein
MAEKDNIGCLFSSEEMTRAMGGFDFKEDQPVTVLGITFENDAKRREYFREELRKKLPELRHIEGFPIGSDDDIINLSDPPYYTACPNPWIKDIINEWEAEKQHFEAIGLRNSTLVVSEPYAEDISVGKNNEIYSAHSYHTKVPHPAIMKLLFHYTQPGDIVYDGFAGTGMTGIACGFSENGYKETTCKGNLGKRFCICGDLSPIASFISYNLNNNNSSDLREFHNILAEVETKYSYLYKTKHNDNEYGTISYVVWSDVIECPHCNNTTSFWSLFVKYGEGELRDEAKCPHCNSSIKRSSSQKLFETYYDKGLGISEKRVVSIPVLIAYKYNNKRYTKLPDEEDMALFVSIRDAKNDSWYPTDSLIDGDKMGDPKAKGITHIHQFYNERTLFLLSKIWERCNERNRFYITNSISRNLTKLNRFIVNRYNPKGRINGPLAGTLYPPSEVVEQNVFELLSEKISKIDNINFNTAIQVADALHAKTIPDNSVDYIFTDPPFGANLMYSELNFISESWIRVKTDSSDEAIENKTQNKTSDTYKDLMALAFCDYYRILKPNKWMTVEFSNTSAKIWNGIQTAIQSAGFVIASVTSFDKVHGGQKSMRYTTSVKEDLIITCYKPNFRDEIVETSDLGVSVWHFMDEHLKHLPIHLTDGLKSTSIVERNPKILYDRMILYFVVNGLEIPYNMVDFQKGLREHYLERDGMFFTPSQITKYDELRKNTMGFQSNLFFVDSEQGGIYWLNQELVNPQTYQELQPKWMKAIHGLRKGDILPELTQILEENFIKELDGKWRKPNLQDDVDLEALRTKSLLREFKIYVEMAMKPKAKIKEARVEALRTGFKQCYIEKDFRTIVTVGDKISQNLLTEDEVLLQFYDIAQNKL